MSDRFDDLFTIEHRDGDDFTVQASGEGFLYGGLTMAILQGVVIHTVDDELEQLSLRTSFLSQGDPTVAMTVAVERVNDSRSMAGRRLRLHQDGHTIAVADATFGRHREGEQWHEPFVVPHRPDDLVPARHVHTAMPVMEVRHAAGAEPDYSERVHPYWARFPFPPTGDRRAWAAAIAYASDYFVINTPFPEGSGTGRQRRGMTVEHALWFHRSTDVADWFHLDARRLSVGGGFYTSRGEVHDGAGALVASFTQTGVVRPIAAG